MRTIAAAVVMRAMLIRFVRSTRRKPCRSSVACAVDSAGNAANANATPMTLTGTLWKLRAKLTAVTLPAASVVATDVKKRNVIGSTGWLTTFGSMSRTNSRTEAVRKDPPRPIRKRLDRSPMKRLARCRTAPMTAPIAGPKIPRPVNSERAEDDPGVVEEGRKPVPEEALLGEEHLAQRQ